MALIRLGSSRYDRTKLALFADLHTRVARHKTTLDERAAMLETTRARLVKDSGNVIDGGDAGTGTRILGSGSGGTEIGASSV